MPTGLIFRAVGQSKQKTKLWLRRKVRGREPGGQSPALVLPRTVPVLAGHAGAARWTRRDPARKGG